VNRKLGIGVLGVGDMGRRHAENIRRVVPAARLVAVADVNLERAKRVAGELEIEHYFPTLEGMLECEGIDAVVIACPDKFHAKSIETAAAREKDIFCEKPIATNLADAHSALRQVAITGVRLQIGFMRRYDRAHDEASKRIEAGEIGEPVIFKSIGRDKDIPPISTYQSNVNGMLFYNSTIHDFDLARWLVGDEVSEVQAYSTVAIRPEVAEYGDVVASVVNLKYAHGAIGNVESYVQALYAYDVRTEVVGSKGSIFIGSLKKTPVTFLATNGAVHILEDHYLSRFAEAYVLEIEDFVDNVLHERPPRVTGDDGLKALAIAVAAERSHLRGDPCEVSTEAAEMAGKG
jgi:scyllo-inositol 2-dehydrogenase (NAD+)